MTQHLDIRVHGMVQGVGFRYAAVAEARGCGVTGFIRNEPDGTVYIEAEGPSNALERFVTWCRRGPAAAVVRKVETSAGALQHYADFDVAFGR